MEKISLTRKELYDLISTALMLWARYCGLDLSNNILVKEKK